jgi:hypothetical protein
VVARCECAECGVCVGGVWVVMGVVWAVCGWCVGMGVGDVWVVCGWSVVGGWMADGVWVMCG